ncbi:ATP-dependent chromatin remodeler [Malassezia pachydermatis]
MEAMRQRLLAQQLGLNSPSGAKRTEEKQDTPSTPATPKQGKTIPSIQPWRTEPRVKMMPFQTSTPVHTPDRARPQWGASTSTPTRVAMSRRGFLTPTPRPATPDRSGKYYTNTPGSTTPLASQPHISAAERDKQLQKMLSGIVTVMNKVDLDKARVPGMKCMLLPHQIQGVDWMRRREHGKAKGGILADDMGLGKTVQMLALILHHRSLDRLQTTIEEEEAEASDVDPDDLLASYQKEVWSSNTKTTLIVAPVAVIEQWQREAQDKTGHALRVYIHHGPQRAKTVDTLKKADVVITSYATAANEHDNFLKATGALPQAPSTRRRKEKTKSEALLDSDSSDVEELEFKPASEKKKGTAQPRYPLFEMNWLRVVLDEAQNIKNYRAKSSLACFQLSLRAASRWCISGTPLQNNALEIFSLIHFLRIPPFDDLKHFQEKISDPLKSNKQERIDLGMRRLGVVLQSIMIRRTKDAEYQGRRLLDLPPRNVEIVSHDFTSTHERDFYRELEQRIQTHLKENGESKMNYMGVLLMLLRLRQACNHPVLVTGKAAVPVTEEAEPEPVVSVQDEDDELAALLSGLSVKTRRCERCQVELEAASTEQVSALCPGCAKQREHEQEGGIHWDGPGIMSTKLTMMMDLLASFDKQAKDDKTIIFSQFTTFLDLIEPALEARGYDFVRYDGAMRRPAREAALQRIRMDPGVKVILISFKAGSTGLNLTCCNRVILCDLWWNPQIEEQAFDRAHRYVEVSLTIDWAKQKAFIFTNCPLLARWKRGFWLSRYVQCVSHMQEKKRQLAKAALEGQSYVSYGTLTLDSTHKSACALFFINDRTQSPESAGNSVLI